MLVLVTYDVGTQTPAGKKRLRKVAKFCENYGVRVQNSVFECQISATQYVLLTHGLEELIDAKTDSLRFYSLGNAYQEKTLHIGAKPAFDVTKPLIL